MSGTEQQMEIDLGDMPKVENKAAEEPIVEIIDENASPAEEEAPRKDDPEKALKKLQKKLEQEQKAREEAEKMARQAAEQARQATIEAQDSRIHLVNGAMETLRRDEEILTAHLKQAMEVGDYDKAAEIQKTIAVNANKMVELERGYDELRKAAPPPPVQPNAPREITVDDIIQQVTPRSQEWLNRHREYLPDSRSIRIMGRAHEDALDMGLIPESDQYFAFVENRLGINKSARNDYQEYDAMSDAAKPTKSRQSPPAAPVSRTPVGSEGTRPGVIRLTADEVEAAKISGISPQEYYRLKMQDRNRN
jgi:hypothetical protein